MHQQRLSLFHIQFSRIKTMKWHQNPENVPVLVNSESQFDVRHVTTETAHTFCVY